MLQYLYKKIIYIKSSDLIKNIATLLSGNILGYGINLLSLPIISRLYTQSELGEYDLIVSSANIVIPVLQLALLLVIMLPKEDLQANCICKIIWGSTIIGSIFIVCFLNLISSRYKILNINAPYKITTVLFGAYIIFNTLQAIYYSYTNRKKLYKILFWNPILMNATNSAGSIMLGIIGLGSLGYLVGTILSYLIAVLHMARFVFPFRGHVSYSYIKTTLSEYKMYPLVQMPANLIQTWGIQLPSQFLGRIFSVATLGGYTMACKILSVPVSLLATPVNRVYYRTLVEKINAGQDAGEFAFSLFSNNIKIAIVPISILMIFGEWIVKFLLGNNWAVSGTYITILGIMYLLKYCVACMAGTYVATKRQSYSIITAVLNLIIYIMCFSLAYMIKLGALETIILYTIFSSIYEIVSISLCMHCLRYSLKKVWIFIAKYILGLSLIVYPIYAILQVCIK